MAAETPKTLPAALAAGCSRDLQWTASHDAEDGCSADGISRNVGGTRQVRAQRQQCIDERQLSAVHFDGQTGSRPAGTDKFIGPRDKPYQYQAVCSLLQQASRPSMRQLDATALPACSTPDVRQIERIRGGRGVAGSNAADTAQRLRATDAGRGRRQP